jgi:AhpD family alkylhydroperoxidase
MSQPRIDLRAVAPDSQRGFRQAGMDARENGIEPKLKHIIDTRVSQMNGCAYCLEMHVREAKAGGESDDRLHLVAAWRETDIFTPRERAALEWAEALTNIQDGHVPDEVYNSVQREFTPSEMVYLSVAVATINAHNRVNIALRTPVGASRVQTNGRAPVGVVHTPVDGIRHADGLPRATTEPPVVERPAKT